MKKTIVRCQRKSLRMNLTAILLLCAYMSLLLSGCGTENRSSGSQFSVTGAVTGGKDVHPEFFGAIGDGTTLDGDAFISSVDYLNSIGGGNLILTAGKDYVIDKEILLYSNIHIQGNGAKLTVDPTTYDVTPNRFFAIFTTVTIDRRPMSSERFTTGSIVASNIHIENITFDMNRDGSTLALGWMRSSDFQAIRYVDVEYGKIENCTFLDGQTSTINILTAIACLDASKNCEFINNKSERCTLIRTNDGSGHTIRGNIMNTSPGTGIEIYLGTHHEITNNELNEQWVDASSLGCSADYTLVSGNRINQSNASGIAMGHPDRQDEGFPPFGSNYCVVENNYVKGGPVTFEGGTPAGDILTGGSGIMLQNGKGVRILNNKIVDLYVDTAYRVNSAAIVVGGGDTDQTLFDDLIISGNTITNATVGIEIRDHINVEVSSNYIQTAAVGIYGQSDINNSPNAKLIIDGNIINDTSTVALWTNCPDNIIINNTINRAASMGYLYYGNYVFNNNTINEGLIELIGFGNLSFTMKDNIFFNTIPLSYAMRIDSPTMELEKVVVKGNKLLFPNSGTQTTNVMRVTQFVGGSNYYVDETGEDRDHQRSKGRPRK